MNIIAYETRSNHKISTISKNLIIMCGWPGCGKSTLAHRLFKGIERSTIISRDHLRDFISDSGFIEPTRDAKIVETDIHLYVCAERLLQEVNTLILDGTFHSFKKRNRVYFFARQNRCEAVIIHCVCSREAALRRLRRQIEAREKVFNYSPEQVIAYYEKKFDQPIPEAIWANVITVDTQDDFKPTIVDKRLKFSSPFVQSVIDVLELPILL